MLLSQLCNLKPRSLIRRLRVPPLPTIFAREIRNVAFVVEKCQNFFKRSDVSCPPPSDETMNGTDNGLKPVGCHATLM